MKTGLIAGALLALGLTAGIAHDALAARSLVARVTSGVTVPNYAVATSDGSLLVVASGSANSLTIVDGRSFAPVTTSLVLSSGGTGVKSLTIGLDATTEVAAGTNNGRIEQWSVATIGGVADGAASPVARSFKLAGTPGAVSGLAIDTTGARVFAAGYTSKAVDVFDDVTGTSLAAGILLNHAPIVAIDTATGVNDRVWFGTDDGNLAYLDGVTYLPSIVAVDGTQTHDYSAMALSVFPGGLTRLLVADRTADSLLVVDPSSAIVLTTLGLQGEPEGIAVSGASGAQTIWIAERSLGGTSVNQVEALTSTLGSAQSAVALPLAPVSLVEGAGWLWAGLTDGTFGVITDRPYVEITSITPNPISDLTVNPQLVLSSTEAGAAKFFADGVHVGNANVVAGSNQTFSLSGAALAGVLSEGRNRLRVEVTGSTSGLIGHDEEVLRLDRPPPTPTGFRVDFGDGRVIATWDDVDPVAVPDFRDYEVRFGTQATGTNGVGTKTSPIHTANSYYILNVANGTTVYMSVLTRDSAGNLSTATAVKSATAQPTAGAAELAGDKGGFIISCGVGRGVAGARALASVAGAAIALWLMRSRSRRNAS